MLNKRSCKLEWLDAEDCLTKEEYKHYVLQLDKVGRFLGGDKANFWAIDQIEKNPRSILDLGCGGGHFTMRLAKRYPQACVKGIDTSQQAIDFANQLLNIQCTTLSNVSFEKTLVSQLNDSSKTFDLIISTLVFHHLSDEEIIDTLKKCYSIAKKGIIINDLHRDPLALIGFGILGPLLLPNRRVIYDGLVSIQKGFKRKDWINYLEKARIPLERCSIKWHWPYRWIVMIRTS